MRNAQEYIDNKYPHFIQQNIKKLDISNLNLVGVLDLGNFTKLEELNCSNNLLTRLDLRYCANLKLLNADNNRDLQLWWGNTIKKQVGYLEITPEKTPEEIRTSKIKKARREGCFIPNSLVWNSLHPNFDFELSQEWKNLGFDFEQAKDWMEAGFKPTDLKICVWLRDVKKVKAEWVLNYASERKIRQEFERWQQEQIVAQIEVQLNIK